MKNLYFVKAFKPFDGGVFVGLMPFSFQNRITPYDKKIQLSAMSLSLGYMIN